MTLNFHIFTLEGAQVGIVAGILCIQSSKLVPKTETVFEYLVQEGGSKRYDQTPSSRCVPFRFMVKYSPRKHNENQDQLK